LDEHIGAVLAQHVQIDQVILNLARNAIEAMLDMPEGSRVLTISTQNQQDGYVKVTVSDTGPGLDASIVDQLFNPFVTTKSNGMGLGLSISQGIIEAHKGRIFVEPDSLKGATFVFQLPTSQTRETTS
jgi:two-component system sensor kinase FixL